MTKEVENPNKKPPKTIEVKGPQEFQAKNATKDLKAENAADEALSILDGVDFSLTEDEKIDSEYPAGIDEILNTDDDDVLTEHLAYLQRRMKEHKVPVMIVLEGAYASGKGRIANELILGLDARYTNFIDTRPPSEDDLKKPFLNPYQSTIPNNNQFNIYYRSWYSQYNYYKNHLKKSDHGYKDPSVLIEEIRDFEKALVDDGTVIIKFKIRIDKQKQAEHIRSMMEDPLTTWKAQEFDRDNNEIYVKEMEELMQQTNEDYAPWYIIKYTNTQETTMEVMRQVIDILNQRLEELEAKKDQPVARDGLFGKRTEGLLEKIDPNRPISNEEYSSRLKPLQKLMREIQFALYKERIPLVLVFEGWDAAGKGGAIHRLIAKLDPTNYTVNTTAAPNEPEKNHHYLWRFANKIPRAGHISIWDRSWYGRVMVERVEGFASNEEWQRAYEEINNFERVLTNHGTILLKFFIHIDKETQLERFDARQNDPAKRWKITEEDWRNREKWDQYTESINDMIEKTSTNEAPWIIIEGNDKKFARIKVLETVLKACDERLKLINLRDTKEGILPETPLNTYYAKTLSQEDLKKKPLAEGKNGSETRKVKAIKMIDPEEMHRNKAKGKNGETKKIKEEGNDLDQEPLKKKESKERKNKKDRDKKEKKEKKDKKGKDKIEKKDKDKKSKKKD